MSIEKQEIAQDFVDKNKWALDAWAPLHVSDKDEKLLQIYNDLMEGNYGEVRKEGDYYEIEISEQDSLSHQPVLFVWSEKP